MRICPRKGVARHRIPAGAGAVARAGDRVGHGTGGLERPTRHRGFQCKTNIDHDVFIFLAPR